MLKGSGKNGHPRFILDLRRKAFIFSPLNMMMLAVGLSHVAFTVLKYVPSVPNLLIVFIVFIMKGC